MRIPAITCFMLCLAAGNAAADDVYEPHALLYVQTSFSGSAQDRKTSFGLRLDQTYHARDVAPDFRKLLARPALAEFRMDSDGVRFLNVAGTDFARAYRVHRANAEGGTAPVAEGVEPAEPAAAEPAAEATEQADSEEASAEDEGRSLGEYLEEIPAGYFIGIGLGVVLLTGLGD